jgi:hypothetical protein
VPRVALITTAVFGLFLFAGASFLLARALTGPGTERDRVLGVLRAQARGDVEGMLALLPACAAEPACVRTAQARVPRLERPGEVEILKYDPSIQVALVNTTATGRVAWRAGTGLPVVQCVRVRRRGPLDADRVELLALSDALEPDASC